MTKLYRYIGSTELLPPGGAPPRGTVIRTVSDITTWITSSTQVLDNRREVTTTFIIDPQGRLLIADRHCEHVVCAGGEPVLAAGEMTFVVSNGQVRVVAVSNQSTGYCPEPSSWAVVDRALRAIGLPLPARYSVEFTFRRCPTCRQLNIVKEGVFECGVCSSELPQEWNCDDPTHEAPTR